jgi:hypothetical protein
MRREFNVTGSCNPDLHYMVDVSAKFADISKLVARGKYFIINRPRQYGKTTMMFQLQRRLGDEYLVLPLSFEGVGDTPFESEENLAELFPELLATRLDYIAPPLAEYVRKDSSDVCNFKTLGTFITRFVREAKQQVVLMIDEVDKSSNSQAFLSFIGLLRDKYLLKAQQQDHSFQSVVLAGVHDIKSLKLKVREGDDTKLNSPWNIAADFNVDMSFNPAEIATLLADFASENDVQIDMPAIAERIHYFSSGHPFLVSKLCKILDEEASAQNETFDPTHWTVADIDWAFRWLTRPMYQTTNFDDMIKNLENNADLYAMVRAIAVEGRSFSPAADNPVQGLAVTYGILAQQGPHLAIANRVYEQRIATYLQSKHETDNLRQTLSMPDFDFIADGRLNLPHILARFQAFMQEHHSDRDNDFLEREGRLVFMSFLKPIINGRGFMWKEPVVGDERRMDLVITFGAQKEVLELKLWRGEAYHQAGLQQLSDYLDFQGLKRGFLLIFDFRKSKEPKHETIAFADKTIEAVWV